MLKEMLENVDSSSCVFFLSSWQWSVDTGRSAISELQTKPSEKQKAQRGEVT
jgi:hypothetical protein